MRKKILPNELISLLNHIELNKAGWWEKSIQRFIVTTIWLYKNSLTIDSIVSILLNDYNIHLDKDILIKHIQELLTKGILIPIKNERYKVSEEYQKVIEEELSKTENNEKNVREKFYKINTQLSDLM